MFNRSKFKPKMASKYLVSKWMKDDSKSSISVLDLYDQYREWITDNATGCELELAAFAKKISEVYPDAIIKDGTVRGITPKTPRVFAPPPIKSQLERDVERLLSIFGHFYPNIEYRGFTVRQVLSELRPDEPQITEEQLTDYLTNSDLYFQHPSKGYWLREWRG